MLHKARDTITHWAKKILSIISSLPDIVFIRMHPNVVFLWYKGRNLSAITGDYRLAAPVNFIRGILASGNWTPLDLFDVMLVE